MDLWTRLFMKGKDPDPIANQFLAHIEHVRKSGRIQPVTLEWLDGMICDAILGKHVRFVHTKFREVIEKKVRICEQTFTAAGYFNITTIVPASSPVEACQFMGNSYFAYIEKFSSLWKRKEHKMVHWIVGIGGVKMWVDLTLCPTEGETHPNNIILPIDLLTFQERQRLGL